MAHPGQSGGHAVYGIVCRPALRSLVRHPRPSKKRPVGRMHDRCRMRVDGVGRLQPGALCAVLRGTGPGTGAYRRQRDRRHGDAACPNPAACHAERVMGSGRDCVSACWCACAAEAVSLCSFSSSPAFSPWPPPWPWRYPVPPREQSRRLYQRRLHNRNSARYRRCRCHCAPC